MARATLTVHEHATLRVGEGEADLSPHDVERLVGLSQARPGFCTLGHRSVKFAQYAGLVRLGGRILEVLPKTGELVDRASARGTLLRMLALAHDLPHVAPDGVGQGVARHPLLEVFIAAFLGEVATLVRGGLLRRYLGHAGDLRVVRGRIDFTRQATALGMRSDLVACRFDDLSVDNAFNRALHAALLAVRPWIRALDTHRRWAELRCAFDGIGTCRASDVGRLRVDRLTLRYQPALTWATWILELLSPDLRAGPAVAPAVLFDMNRLFEQAVATTLRRRSQRAGLHVATQESGRHLAQALGHAVPRHFGLRPDLVLRTSANAVLAVADTKWTAVGIGKQGLLTPADDHAYQLHAYAAAYPGAELALIYPADGLGPPASATAYGLGNDGAILHVLRVDVSRDGFPLVGQQHASLLGALLGAG